MALAVNQGVSYNAHHALFVQIDEIITRTNALVCIVI